VNSYEESLNSIPSTRSKVGSVNGIIKDSIRFLFPPTTKPSSKSASEEFLKWLDEQL